MNKILTIGEASKFLGVTIQTLRNWDKSGWLKPDEVTKGRARRYKIESLIAKLHNPTIVLENSTKEKLKTIAYARVSTYEQKSDLLRQVEILELYCAKQGFEYEIIQDLGSGMNYNKKGLIKLINLILQGKVERLILTNKDRLLRFGSELIFEICKAQNVKVIIINKGEEISFENELIKDVLEILTVFSAKLYGKRSHKNKKLIEEMKKHLTN